MINQIVSPSPAGEIVGPGAGTSGTSLPRRFGDVKRRLDRFDDVSLQARNNAWNWLLTWRKVVDSRGGRVLPAPYVYTNDDHVIEFEWETDRGQLMLRLGPGDSLFDYFLTVHQPDGSELDEESQVGIADVCPLITRIL